MRTLVISDLHLGARTGSDVLRRPAPRAALVEALEAIDRLVLLGDVFELRHGPLRDALPAGRELWQALGRAMAGGEIVLLAGNHDHGLIAPWLARRAADGVPPPLGWETMAEPPEVSAAVVQLAQWATPARLRVAHPGVWLREDVWATHGHYLDVHLSVPTGERLAAGVMARVTTGGEAPASAEDYERRLAPTYAWIDAVAAGAATGDMLNGQGTLRAWRLLRGRPSRDGGPVPLTRRAMARGAAAAFPLAVAALNRAGLGPLSPDISARSLQAAGVQAMGEVLEHLRVPARWAVFGHTHRAGPDHPGQWPTPSGAQLLNSGCWIHETHFMGPEQRQSPYWPGGAVEVSDSGPPVLRRLLADLPAAALGPAAD